MKPIYISYFTPGAYAKEAQDLHTSLVQFGLEHKIFEAVDRGEWVLNCGLKPGYLLEAMKLFPGRPVVWLDADAVVKAPPVLFETLAGDGFDVGYCMVAGEGGRKVLASGTLFFGDTENARDLLREWDRQQKNNLQEWDQRVLEKIVSSAEWCNKLKVRFLPQPYTRIVGSPSQRGIDPVIAHYQAGTGSRKDNDLAVLSGLMTAIKIPGDFAEFGVFQGRSLRRMVQAAGNRTVHAVDSFCGMGEPTEKDYDASGKCYYPKGRLSSGVESLGELLAKVIIWKGFIPEILETMSDLKLAFAFVDIDHYLPTLQALEWLQSRMLPGGVIACHDYFPGRKMLSSPAIEEFAADSGMKIHGPDKTVAWFQF